LVDENPRWWDIVTLRQRLNEWKRGEVPVEADLPTNWTDDTKRWVLRDYQESERERELRLLGEQREKKKRDEELVIRNKTPERIYDMMWDMMTTAKTSKISKDIMPKKWSPDLKDWVLRMAEAFENEQRAVEEAEAERIRRVEQREPDPLPPLVRFVEITPPPPPPPQSSPPRSEADGEPPRKKQRTDDAGEEAPPETSGQLPIPQQLLGLGRNLDADHGDYGSTEEDLLGRQTGPAHPHKAASPAPSTNLKPIIQM